jgi:hypothetical protein
MTFGITFVVTQVHESTMCSLADECDIHTTTSSKGLTVTTVLCAM